MQVNGVSSAYYGTGISGGTTGMDSVSKNIQQQIENLRKQMQEVSRDDSLTEEERMKQKQEYQKQINELTIELRQHQMEQKKQEQESRANAQELEREVSSQNVRESQTGMSAQGMQSMISADNAMNIAKVTGRVADELEGKAKILKGEIEADAGRGNVEAKEAQLQSLEEKAANASNTQMKQLGGVVQDVKETVEGKSNPEAAGSEEDTEEVSQTISEMDENQQGELLRRVDILI